MSTATVNREPQSIPSRLTRRDIETYLSLADRKRRLEHKARELATQMEPLPETFASYVQSELKRNRKATFVRSCGYVFSLVSAGVHPACKQAFVAALGEKAAAKVTTSTPPSLRLEVERE
jgi:hypothetical protein